MAEITTIVSSTKSPSDKSSENWDKKLSEMPVIFITVKVMKNVKGVDKSATDACLTPKKMNKIRKTNEIVKIKSLCSSPNCLVISSEVSKIVLILNLPLYFVHALSTS